MNPLQFFNGEQQAKVLHWKGSDYVGKVTKDIQKVDAMSSKGYYLTLMKVGNKAGHVAEPLKDWKGGRCSLLYVPQKLLHHPHKVRFGTAHLDHVIGSIFPLRGGKVKNALNWVDGKDEYNRDSGSPCRRPLPCLMASLGTPLSTTLEETVERSAAIRSLNLCKESSPL